MTPQHLGGSGLLLQCLALLGDQSCVLHSNHCLGRKVLQQRHLLFGERPHLLPENRKQAQCGGLVNKWDPANGADAGQARPPRH